MCVRKVSIVLDYLELGGAERQAIYLADFLHQQPGINVTVIGFRPPGKVSRLLSKKNITWKYIPLTLRAGRVDILKNCLTLLIHFWKFRPNAIIPFTYWPNVLCGLIWKLTTAKVCLWNQRDAGQKLSKNWFTTLAIKNASQIVSNSSEGQLFLATTFSIDPSDISLIFNGVDLPDPKLSKSLWRDQLGIDDNTFVAIMVANLHVHKDHSILVKAWRHVVDQLSDRRAMLLLVGRWDNQYETLVALTNELKLQNNILFTGPIDDISGLLSSTDLGLFSSNKEGCPNAILECMAASLSVVATDIYGARDALGYTYPYLVPKNSPKLFAEKIMFFINNPVRNQCVGERNKRYVMKHFAMKRMQQNYLKVIHGKQLSQ